MVIAYSILGAITLTLLIEVLAAQLGTMKCDEKQCDYLGRPVEWLSALGSWAAVAAAILAVTFAALIDQQRRMDRVKTILTLNREAIHSAGTAYLSALAHMINTLREYPGSAPTVMPRDNSALMPVIKEVAEHDHETAARLLNIQSIYQTLPENGGLLASIFPIEELNQYLINELDRFVANGHTVIENLEWISNFTGEVKLYD